MTKPTITREQAQKIIVAADEVITALAGTNEDVHPDDSKKMCELWDDLNDRHAPPVVVRELARIALSAMDSEPVMLYRQVNPVNGMKTYWAELDPEEFRHLKQHTDENAEFMTLYRHAQPAPVVPEKCPAEIRDLIDSHSDALFNDDDAQEIWNACRAAMLQASNSPEQSDCCPAQNHVSPAQNSDAPAQGGNSPVIPDGWTGNDKANAALMMLDRIETVDPVDDDRIDGIKRIVRELAAAPHDTPALNSVQSVVTVPGKWIPVSERMPDDDDFVYIWPRPDFGVELHVGQYCERSHKGGGWYAQVYEQNYGIEWHPITVTHWMPLPAAPQEVGDA
ncbi:DUF551 domain-containing protein [Klebsiella quasipneumoniae]|uniref:DUF551 domain-containing protein n=1 Tax=Klebsiella quasipneumoniae TaxID=1463165 RepID=UPI0034DEBA4A